MSTFKIEKKFKTLLGFTEAQNRAFAKMTRPQKRVAVAEDVIKALSQKRINPMSGSYLESNDQAYSDKDAYNYKDPIARAADGEESSFRDMIPKLPQCNVCAKGAIFLCAVNRQNRVSTKEADALKWSGDGLSTSLRGLFSADQLDAIEAEFENSPIHGNHESIMRFTDEEYMDDGKRMKKIMRNIVRNGGTFKPAQDGRKHVGNNCFCGVCRCGCSICRRK